MSLLTSYDMQGLRISFESCRHWLPSGYFRLQNAQFGFKRVGGMYIVRTQLGTVHIVCTHRGGGGVPQMHAWGRAEEWFVRGLEPVSKEP